MADKNDARIPLTRKTHPAILPWREQGNCLSLYFQRYISDARFATALLDFFTDNRSTIAEVGSVSAWWRLKGPRIPDDVRRYAGNIGRFAEVWALDRLPRSQGQNAVMHWCWHKHQFPYVGVESFISGAGASGGVPQVGEKVYRERCTIEMPGFEYTFEDYDTKPPTIRVTVESPWHADQESPAAIYDRLVRECTEQIDSQLRHWSEEYENAGYRFPDTEEKRLVHIDWLYQRVVARRTCSEIAGQIAKSGGHNYSVSYIQQKTKEIADTIGVTIPRPSRSVAR